MYLQKGSWTGFTACAEKLNGRLAMIGFVSLLALEVLAEYDLIGALASLSQL